MAVAFVIDPPTRAAIQDLIARASARPFDHADLMARLAAYEAGAIVPGHDDLTVVLPLGWMFTYTEEEVVPGIMCRRLSASYRNQIPPVPMMREIIKEFGFTLPIEDCVVFPEKTAAGSAVNLIAPFDDDAAALRAAIERASRRPASDVTH